MIKLDSLAIEDIEKTSNWNDVVLYAKNSQDKTFRVVSKSYAIGDNLKDFPHATKEKAVQSIEKFKNILVEREIRDLMEWDEKATFEEKQAIAFGCFNEYHPSFA